LARVCTISSDDLGQLPGNRDLLGHADIGAPPDADFGEGSMAQEGTFPVKHDRQRIRTVGPTLLAQHTPGRNGERRADLVDRNGVCGGQGLQGSDAGYDRATVSGRDLSMRDAIRSVLS
jgi:hypothetical protein